MKGIILAGGTGSRMGLSTKVTNKHLLCVYDRPMIFFPLWTLRNMGIKEILIISGKEHVGDMIGLLGSGSDFGVDFTYRVQDGAGGIAEALYLAKNFVGKNHFVVILGDNYFEQNIDVEELDKGKAKIFLMSVKDPKRFGVVEVKDKKVIGIEEKPNNPKSNFIAVGIYIYDWNVFSIVEDLEKSNRGELEITDVHNEYIRRGKLEYSILQGFWSDMGTPQSLLEASNFIRIKNE